MQDETTAASEPVAEPVVTRNAWVTRIVVLAVSLVAAWVIVGIIGRIDWSAVADALGQLHWWQLVVLLMLLAVRQTCNALPLAFFIPGLGIYRAVVNDLASHLLAVAVPPPGDMVMRIAMFTSWGVEASRAIAGSLMNMIAFYVTRLSVPVIGFLLLLTVDLEVSYGLSALFSAAAAATLIALVFLGLRSEDFARRTGLTAGAWVGKVRRSVSAEAWADAVVGFRLDMKDTFARGYPRSLVALLGLVFTDATMLLLSLRFVGVGPSEVSAIAVYAGFLCVYPLTMFPFMGLGIVDALLLAIFVEAGGDGVEAAGVAALVVWRSITLVGPVLLGAVSLGIWKHSVARAAGTIQTG